MWAHLCLFSWLYLSQCLIFSLFGSFYFPCFCITTKSTCFAFSYSPYSIVSTSWLFFLLFCTWMFSSMIFFPHFSSQVSCPLWCVFTLSFTHLSLSVFPLSTSFFLISVLFDLSQFPPFCQPLHLLIISRGSLTLPFHHSLFSDSFVPPPPCSFLLSISLQIQLVALGMGWDKKSPHKDLGTYGVCLSHTRVSVHPSSAEPCE